MKSNPQNNNPGVTGIVDLSFLSKPVTTLIKTVLVTGAVVGGYLFVRKKINDSKAADEALKIGSDLNTQQAAQLHSILDTFYFSENDSDKAVEVAYKIKSWPAVQESYSRLYSKNLLQDLQSKMSDLQFRRFIAVVSGQNQIDTIKANTTKVTTVNNPPSSPVRAGANVRVKKSQALPLNLYNTPEDAMAVTKVGNEYKPDPRPNGVIRTHTTAAFAKVITTKLYTFTPVGKSPVNVVFAQIQFLATPSIVRWINAAALETVSTGVKGLGCAACNGKCGMGCSCNAMPIKQLNGIHIA